MRTSAAAGKITNVQFRSLLSKKYVSMSKERKGGFSSVHGARKSI